MLKVFLTWTIQYSVFSFYIFLSRHLAVGLKKEQKRDHISAQHRGEVQINWKRWEVLHSGDFQVLNMPKTFFNPYLESRKLHPFPPLCCFWNKFYFNLRVVSRLVVVLCLLDFLASYYSVGCDQVARVCAAEPACCFLIFCSELP